VAQGNVRRSTVFEVKVASRAAPGELHESFVYMSLARSARGKDGYRHEDGAEFADEADLTMRRVAIENYVVDGERIRKAADNWQADRRGRVDFDASLWENWNDR
jgi:hypothetical protein